MKLSVVLLTWNSAPFLRACLDSVFAEAPQDTQVIVVDNGSRDGSQRLIEQRYPGVAAIRNEANRGVGPARNQGLQVARGEYVLVLDIDTVVCRGALATLIRGMDEDPRVGLAGARLVSPEGDLQYTCRGIPTVWTKVCRQLPPGAQERLLRRDEMRDWDHATRRYVGHVIGACQCIRREAMREVGLYDERIRYGPEDVDYCLRMWKAGWRVLYNPEATIVHAETRITRRKRAWRNPLFWVHLKGLAWYFWKHRYLFRAPSLLPAGDDPV